MVGLLEKRVAAPLVGAGNISQRDCSVDQGCFGHAKGLQLPHMYVPVCNSVIQCCWCAQTTHNIPFSDYAKPCVTAVELTRGWSWLIMHVCPHI